MPKGASAPANDLVKDERGAVMIIGLAMILSLIAFLWYILGIGETFAFRDHMQDAADSAAFSQTAVEAAGMNLIVLLNMVIMLMVIIYLVLSIAVTVQWITVVAAVASVIGNVGVSEADAIDYVADYNSRNNIAKGLAIVDRGLNILESFVAMAAPWAGTAAGVDASMSFKMSSQTSAPIGIAFSPNNFPDSGPLKAFFTNFPPKGDLSGEYGLPVTHEILGNDCAHLVNMIGGAVLNLFGNGSSGFLGIGGTKKWIKKLKNWLDKGIAGLAVVVQWYYCDNTAVPPVPLPGFFNSVKSVLNKVPGLSTIERELIGGGDGADYWMDSDHGPMKNYAHVDVHVDQGDTLADALKTDNKRHAKEQKNGADHNQSYSILIMPGDISDHHATSNMGLAQMQNLKGFGIAEQKATPLFYFAQSELYFDCNDSWSTLACDDITDGNDELDMTMYSFSWRARLVKFHVPEGGTLQKISDFVNKGLGMITDVKAWINGNENNPFVKILKFLDQLTGVDLIGVIGGFADLLPVQIFH